MTKQTSKIMALVVIAGLAAVLIGCRGIKTNRETFSNELQIQTIAAGKNAKFGVPENKHILTYQWTFDGTNILGATNSYLVITNVQFDDVGAYRVSITGIKHVYKPFFLNVYMVTPSGGTLSVAIGQEKPGLTTGCFTKSDGWDKYFALTYFIGPFTANPTGNLYPNPNNITAVTVDTCDINNSTKLQTGVVIMDNINPTNFSCEGSTCDFSSHLGGAQLTNLQAGHKYRAGIFYKSTTLGGLTKINYRWNYP